MINHCPLFVLTVVRFGLAKYIPIKITQNANQFNRLNCSEKITQAIIAVIAGSNKRVVVTKPGDSLLRDCATSPCPKTWQTSAREITANQPE